MKGHENLIQLRREGRVPHSVWITDSDDHYSRETASEWDIRPSTAGKLFAHIRIEALDTPEELDLLCLRGLECHVSSDRGDSRFLRLFQAACDAGASAVAGLSAGEVHVFKPTSLPL
jgi:hypothetical protein